MAFKDRIVVAVDFVTDGASKSFKTLKTDIAAAEGGLGKLKVAGSGALSFLKANAVLAGAAIGGAIVVGAAKAIEAASALEEQVSAVEQTFGDAAAGLLEVGEGAAESMGLSERAFAQAAVSFGAFAKTVAGEGGDVAGVIETLIQRGGDFASRYDLEVADALDKFRSGLAGETEPLRRFGIDLSAAAVGAFAVEEGMVASASAMTEADKVAVRYKLLLQETEIVAGDFAETSDGLANSQRTLEGNVENLSAEVGEHLVPAVADAVGSLNDLLGVLKEIGAVDLLLNVEDVKPLSEDVGLLEGALEGAKRGFKTTVNPVAAFSDAISDLREMVDGNTDDLDELDAGLVDTGKSARLVQTSIDAAEASMRAAAMTAEDLAGSNKQVNDAIHDAIETHKEFGEAAEEETQRALDAWNRLKDDISVEREVLKAEQDFSRALEGMGEDTRSQRLAVLDMREAVIDFGIAAENIPDEAVTEVLAKIDEGSYRVAEARLKVLTDRETKTISVYVPAPTGPGAGSIRYSHTGSLFEPGEPKRVQPGQAFIPAGGAFTAPTAGRMLSESETTRRANGTPTPHTGGMTVSVTVNAGLGADGAVIGKQIVDVLKKYERHNGAGWRT